MSKHFIWAAALTVSALALAACNDTTSNTNSTANANANTSTIGTRTEPTATATATPRYSEEQARDEREKAKANKETVGQSLEDAWIHTKVVAKLITNSQTPEREINVDVVDGAVTLRGQVDTAEGKTEAERLAKDTDGVKSVRNELKVVAGNSNKSTTGNSNKATKGKTR